jgi:hypothetical protein
MRPKPEQCREHSDHCRKMAWDEFQFLAEKWSRLASDLERAQVFRPDVPPNVVPLERARR